MKNIKTKTGKKVKNEFIIAIDGGGTKTTGVFSDRNGVVLARKTVGASNPNKVGFKESVKRLEEIMLKLKKVVGRKKADMVGVTYIALAGGLQRNEQLKKNLAKALKKDRKISFIFKKGKAIIEGDELAAFRAGSSGNDGVLLIAGTGSFCCGWHGRLKSQTLGWDWFLGDEGSGFWLGQRALWAVCRDLDGRLKNTLLTKLIFRKLKIKSESGFIRKIYSGNVVENAASLSEIVDKAALNGDKEAKKILLAGAEELAEAAIKVIKDIKIANKSFPIVLAGGVFNSKILTGELKKIIKKIAPKTFFVKPKKEPVFGALEVAKDKLF